MSTLKDAQILIWSSRFDSVDGQSIVTRRVVEQQGKISWLKALYRPGGGFGIVHALLSAALAYILLITKRPDSIYLVCSRSKFGFWRDFPLLILAVLGCRVIVHTHGSDLLQLFSADLTGWFATKVYTHCELIVPSSHLVEPAQEVGFRRIYLCENFMVEGPNAKVARTAVPGTLRILWNSNIMSSKGIKELVEGISIARKGGANIEIVVLGRPIKDSEATADEMLNFVHQIDALDWVTVAGVQPSDKAVEMINDCDLVALPSRYPSECQPLALIAAMAAARKILIRDTPALRATVGDYPTHVVAGDAASIAIALESICASSLKSGRNVEAASRRARARFSPARFDSQIRNILLSHR